ncbi:MAG TPA: hypothetical protein PK668_22450 [Myxococcota bacterium]|nr:hypothetical protein [Myxococcota bacterium]HRY96263.1 hypothetical protein [Myxococcota bacterium]HSA20445.1 hypothetical protein [Myxococcota bacterium]
MVDTIQESLPAPSRSRKRGSGWIIAALLILALLGVIVYLLSLLNSKKYFLAAEGEQLVVKQGIFFLAGSDRFRPSDPALAGLYEPIDLPPGHRGGEREFEDLPSLNTELAAVMLQQAEVWVFAQEDALYKKGVNYLDRLGKLNGLSQSQLKAIEALRADVDYLEARSAYAGVEDTLEDALRKFRKSKLNEDSRFKDTEAWIGRVQHLLETIRESKEGPRPVLPEAPPAEPGAVKPGETLPAGKADPAEPEAARPAPPAEAPAP